MSPPDAERPASERGLHASLSTKLLQAWAENRQQVQAPLALNLGRLDAAKRDLIRQALSAALAARDGTPDAALLDAALARIGGGAEDAEAALAGRPDLFALLAALQRAEMGAHAFAAASLLLDRRVPMERAFLDWLAGRLALPRSVSHGLARRYGR